MGGLGGWKEKREGEGEGAQPTSRLLNTCAPARWACERFHRAAGEKQSKGTREGCGKISTVRIQRESILDPSPFSLDVSQKNWLVLQVLSNKNNNNNRKNNESRRAGRRC